MALFPFISTLGTVHLYGHLGANPGTNGAAGTFAVAVKSGWQITGRIHFVGKTNQALRAEGYAQFASLTVFLRNFDRPLHADFYLHKLSRVYSKRGDKARIFLA